jgi:hypothetical protein
MVITPSKERKGQFAIGLLLLLFWDVMVLFLDFNIIIIININKGFQWFIKMSHQQRKVTMVIKYLNL